MLSPLKARRDIEAARPVSFAEFDPHLVAMRNKQIELAAREDELLGQITIKGKGYQPSSVPTPIMFTAPKDPISARARAVLGDVAPPPPQAAPPVERLSSPVAAAVISLQRDLTAVREAREILNHEIDRRCASASRLYCASRADEYAPHVKTVTDAIVVLTAAFRDHDHFIARLHHQGVQLAFLQPVQTDLVGGFLGSDGVAKRLVDRAHEAGHVDARAALAEARKSLPLPTLADPHAAALARLTRAQRFFEDAKRYAVTKFTSSGSRKPTVAPVLADAAD